MALLLSVLVSSIPPVLIGVLLVSVLAPPDSAPGSSPLYRISLGLGLGLGISATLFFLWLLVSGKASAGIVLAEAVLALGLLGGMLLGSRWGRKAMAAAGRAPDTPAAPGGRLALALIVICALSAACALAIQLGMFTVRPQGEWDAWALWNLRARFLFRAGEHWRETFYPSGTTPPDYPLLLPGSIARIWGIIGEDSTIAPRAIAMLFTMGTAMLLFATVRGLRGSAQAALATLCLFGTSQFIYAGSFQMADTPLGYFILGTLSLFTLYDHAERPAWQLCFLAGLAAGCATWTKNEGALFLLAVLATRIGLWAIRGRRSRLLAELGPFLAGCAPFVLLTLYFKLALAPPTVLLEAQSGASLSEKLLDPGRYTQILRHYAVSLATFGRGSLVIMALALLLLGLAPSARRGILIFIPGLALLMLAGYFVIYLITPYRLDWHLSLSFQRLVVQLWPSLVLATFLAARTPEEMLRGSAGAQPEGKHIGEQA